MKNKILLILICCSILSCGKKEAGSTTYDRGETYTYPSEPTVSGQNLHLQKSGLDQRQVINLDGIESDPYDEGFDEGADQGWEDGNLGLHRGANFDNANDYEGDAEEEYEEGYEDGYEEGWEEGTYE